MDRCALVVALLLGSCLKPSLTSCPTVDCPSNMVCDGRGGCALPEQLSDCAGKADGDACSYPGVADGACTSSLCLPVGCGNSILTPNEVCDDGNTNNGDGCSADCKSNETCGNSIPDPAMGEQCDDGNTTQDDGCHDDCQFARCGDGIIDSTLNEACDDGDGNSNQPNGCRPNCQLPRCGDNILDDGEVCDDGDVINGNGCSADCTSDETCGNGVVDAFKGEVCDDGGNVDGDHCSADCTSTEACGNGFTDTLVGEVCDDGNTINGDGCSSDCKSTEGCGNGIVDTFREQCDLGTANSDAPNSACRLDCKLPSCGDEIIDDDLGEVCDDGLESDGDGVFNSNTPNARCRKNCQFQRCGDGIQDPAFGEVCDDGNSTSGDHCSADCKSLEQCGNGIIDAVNQEQCDEGLDNANTPDAPCRLTCVLPKCGDGIKDPSLGEGCDDPAGNSNAANAACRTNCQVQRCGDGITDTTKGEVCDDGNAVAGDGCSADCRSREICGNAIVDVIKNEQCDAGAANNTNNPNAVCRPTCVLPRCGDGIKDDISLGEACDLGAANSNNANATCRPNCELRRCGDGIKDTAFGEVCDDGNLTSGDGCSADCKSLETCGNGIVDLAKNEQCDDANSNNFDNCHNNCTLPRCGDGIKDFNEQCDLAANNSNNPNAACRANCSLPRCGDNIVDNLLGEVCDDGNLVTGDTCRPDCKSNLTCGNKIVDLEMNEQCDDGNLRNRDGCGACQNEDIITLVPGATPPARRLHSMAYDGARQRVVMFGGLSAQGAVLADTWEWDGVSWTQMRPKKAPQARHGAAMGYDQKRKRVLLFGGFTQSSSKNDTWEWNGIDWVERTPAAPPSNNGFHTAMAYDAVRGTMILTNCSTYEWNGTNWNVLGPTGNQCVNGASMAYDAIRNQIVMITGTRTLVWTGTGANGAWSDKGTIVGFPSGFRQSLVFDASIGKVVLPGGTQNVTWEWNGTAWAQVSFTGQPAAPRLHTAAAYDAVRRHVVLFGGLLGSNGSTLGDTVLRRAATWFVAPPFTQPSPRMAASVAYDPLRKRVVMFGGDQFCIPCSDHNNETWEWDGRQFHEIDGVRPIPQSGTAMIYNAESRSVMMLATSLELAESQNTTDGFGTLDRLFAYNGTDWSEVPAPDHPVVRNTSLVFDGVNNFVMSFGGRDEQTGGTSQVLRAWTPDFGWFEFDGGNGPVSRLSGTMMAYDPIRQRTIVFGGKDDFRTPLDDIWEWDGGGWIPFDQRGPSARFGHTVFYNPDARQISVYGNASNAANVEDLWDWDGDKWTQRAVDAASAPLPHYKQAVAYDSARHQIFTFGGRDQSFQTASQLALLQYRAAATTEACTYATLDYDKDGKAGCTDDECWSVCTPLCPPGSPTSCATTTPRCGDGQCSAFEDCNICPADCGVCSGTCGDFSCGVGETASNCPNDC